MSIPYVTQTWCLEFDALLLELKAKFVTFENNRSPQIKNRDWASARVALTKVCTEAQRASIVATKHRARNTKTT